MLTPGAAVQPSRTPKCTACHAQLLDSLTSCDTQSHHAALCVQLSSVLFLRKQDQQGQQPQAGTSCAIDRQIKRLLTELLYKLLCFSQDCHRPPDSTQPQNDLFASFATHGNPPLRGTYIVMTPWAVGALKQREACKSFSSQSTSQALRPGRGTSLWQHQSLTAQCLRRCARPMGQ